MSVSFSVIIPTYNQADFLRDALDSVLKQTYQDYEIVVVNNHSTDHTLDVIQQVNNGRIRVINYQNNGIIGAARNIGIKATTGDYIAFLDSDDTWHPTKLKRVSEVISADPQLGLICHDQEIMRDGKMAKISRYGPPGSLQASLHDYLVIVGNCISTSATAVARRYVVEAGLFSEEESLITVEDYDLWVRLSDLCSFHFIREVLGTQYLHSSSSSANAEMHLRSQLAILEKHRIEMENLKRPYSKSELRIRNAKVFFGAARQYHRTGAMKNAFRYYLRTFKAYPLYQNTYAGLGLLMVDLLLGQARRKKITESFMPGI